MARPIPSRLFISILCLIIVLLMNTSTTTAQQTVIHDTCPNYKGNYTSNSTYSTNLGNLLFSLIPDTTTEPGRIFFNASSGNAPDAVNGIAQCRGDVAPEACSSCLGEAGHIIGERCPNQKQAAVWYDHCMLRYSNASILGVMVFDADVRSHSQNVPRPSSMVFAERLWALMDAVKNRAANGGSLRKFATGNSSVSDGLTVYGLAQCTPDLSFDECNDCLDNAIGSFRRCCGGSIGAQVLSSSCNLRFETSLFYDSTDDDVPSLSPSPPPPPPSTSSTTNSTTTPGKKKSNSNKVVVAVVVPSIVVILVLIIGGFAYLRRRKEKKMVKTNVAYEPVEEIAMGESLNYSFETIRVATDDFSEVNRLGQGGFGPVYKGLLSNGQHIAVKRLVKGSAQGDMEFKNEVMLVAKLQHRNLVRLLGFCLEGSERLLVYEFVPNASLDQFIFDPRKRSSLDWGRRYKIIGGIARGLLYLHEDSRLRIIHRDLKASNILLDEEMQAKISDFGMAKLFVVDQTQANTSRIVGTYGYMAPEYAMHGQFSVKSDVFSFGVLLLEIVSGQKNNGFRNGDNEEDLLSYAWRNWRDGTATNIVDSMMSNVSGPEIMRCVHIALLCVQENVASRPTMNTVVLMLNSFSMSLPVPSEPAFFMHSSSFGPNTSMESDFSSRVTERDYSKNKPSPASGNEASFNNDHYAR